jgi:hypothetical protein
VGQKQVSEGKPMGIQTTSAPPPPSGNLRQLEFKISTTPAIFTFTTNRAPKCRGPGWEGGTFRAALTFPLLGQGLFGEKMGGGLGFEMGSSLHLFWSVYPYKMFQASSLCVSVRSRCSHAGVSLSPSNTCVM